MCGAAEDGEFHFHSCHSKSCRWALLGLLSAQFVYQEEPTRPPVQNTYTTQIFGEPSMARQLILTHIQDYKRFVAQQPFLYLNVFILCNTLGCTYENY